MNLNELTDTQIIDLHKRMKENLPMKEEESHFKMWEVDRELFARANSELKNEKVTVIYADNEPYIVSSTLNIDVGSITDAVTTTTTTGDRIILDYSYPNTSGCLYYVNTLNYVVYYTIHAKYKGRDYLVGEKEFSTHQEAREKLAELFKLDPELTRVELVTERGSFNEYDYPKAVDIERFYIRQQHKETNPIPYWTTTYPYLSTDDLTYQFADNTVTASTLDDGAASFTGAK